MAKNFEGTCTTFLLLHLGQLGFAAPCSLMLSSRSNVVPHFSQR